MDEYVNKICVGITSNKDNTKYLLYFKYKTIKYRKVLNFELKNWSKRDKSLFAQEEMIKIKRNVDDKKENDSKKTLDDCVNDYFKFRDDTEYNKQKKNYYNNHLIKTKISKMKIKDILAKDIKEVLFNFKGMSERTKKTAIEILSPVFREAIENRICVYNPCSNIKIKIKTKKKIIINATEELTNIIEAIEVLYKDDPFYYCLFSFYIQGRRKSEVLRMLWKNINIEQKFYVIEDVKNGENQKFFLSDNIIKRIGEVQRRNKYVFASFTKSDDHIKNLRFSVKKIRDYTKTNFTLKDTRNIITSAMGENGENAIFQSGTLGHKSLKTIDKYSTLNYEKGSKKASELINNIISQ